MFGNGAARATYSLGLKQTDPALGMESEFLSASLLHAIMHFKNSCLMLEQHLARPPHTFGPHSSIQVHSQSATAYPPFLLACCDVGLGVVSGHYGWLACLVSAPLFDLAVTG